jgi:hypothetical protein
MISDSRFAKAQGPCWEGYEMIGYKTQNGKKVPNCVKVDTKKANNTGFEIVEVHPRCEGPALVETNGTSVLCYGSMEEARAALEDMGREAEPASVRPNDMSKIWKGSGFETPRCCP